MAPDCPRCGERLALIDETTRVIEYRCPNCYTKEVVHKERETR